MIGPGENTNLPEDLGLAKARYEYCLLLYEREQTRRTALENKAQIHLSLISVFLGALLLQMDFLEEVRKLLTIHSTQIIQVGLLYFGCIVFSLSIILSLLGILFTIKTRAYTPEYPASPSLRLFNPESDYLVQYTEVGFYRSIAMSYTTALESDSHINNQKNSWLALASYALVSAVFSFALVIGIISYLQLLK